MQFRTNTSVPPVEVDQRSLPMTETSSAIATVARHDEPSTPVSIMKPPSYATVDDDLEAAMPRPSRSVSFIERSTTPPPHQNLYDLVRPPTPVQDPRQEQQTLSGLEQLGLVLFFFFEIILLTAGIAIIIFAAMAIKNAGEDNNQNP